MTSTPPRDRQPVVISGPSGVGKGTLIQKLVDAHPHVFTSTVSHTTRAPRPGEVEGVTYFYVSFEEFSSLVSRNAFVEHTTFGGHFYGTSKQTISDKAAGGVVVLDIELHGVKQMKASRQLDARYVFIKPPSLEALEERLRNRATEGEESIQRRLAQAVVELEYADTPGFHDIIIVNDDLDKAYQQLEEFIFTPPV